MFHLNPMETRLTKWGDRRGQVVCVKRNSFKRLLLQRLLSTGILHVILSLPTCEITAFPPEDAVYPAQDSWSPCRIAAYRKTEQTFRENITFWVKWAKSAKQLHWCEPSYSTIPRQKLHILIKRLWPSATVQREAVRSCLRWKKTDREILTNIVRLAVSARRQMPKHGWLQDSHECWQKTEQSV